jgi:YegS/Rv2252/BmrU family lipid kinase
MTAPEAGRTAFIANPVAGGGTARTAAIAASEFMDRRGAPVQVQWTRGAGHATRLAQAAVAGGATRVIACGGDGTVNEVAAGVVGSGTALGVIAAGRGNDFALALGLPLLVRDAVNVVLGPHRGAVDVGRMNNRLFLTVAAVGFDAEVAEQVLGGAFNFLGRHAYLAGTLQLLMRYRAAEMTIRGDFGERRGRYLLVATGNTDRYGGGIRITPGASPHDGMLDCCLIRDLSRLRLLRLLPSAFEGQHTRYPEVELVRTRTVQVEAQPPVPVAADGEMAGRTPVAIQVEPRALTVMLAPPALGT